MIAAVLALALLWTGPPAHAVRTPRARHAPIHRTAAHHTAKHRTAAHPTAKRRATARRVDTTHRSAGISPQRVRQIQQALVTAGYDVPVDAQWGPGTIAALRKFQQAHHWQAQYTPDARALIALGLGPAQDEPAARSTVEASAKNSPIRSPGSSSTLRQGSAAGGESSAASAAANQAMADGLANAQ